MAASRMIRGIHPRGHDDAAIGPHRDSPSIVVPVMILGAWLVILVAQATGWAVALHHHALIEGGPPVVLAVPMFLLGWLVMSTAMMLPASLPAIRLAEAGVGPPPPSVTRAAFVAPLLSVWCLFGLLVFLGDVVLHGLVDATPWLAARPWLIEAGILVLAGTYQFVPLKRRSLAACRHPRPLAASVSRLDAGMVRLGVRHGLDCVCSSWALMLLMFGEGFASLPWMVALTALMAYEATGRHAARAATGAGIVLVLAALTVVSATS